MDSIVAFLGKKYLSLSNVIPIGEGVILQNLSTLGLTATEVQKVESMLPYLMKGEVIVKKGNSGKIEIITQEYYKKWNDYYGEGLYILLASKH